MTLFIERNILALLVIQHNVVNESGSARSQYIVVAVLHPMVTAGRGLQMVGAPIGDHVLAVPIFARNACAPAPVFLPEVSLVIGAAAFRASAGFTARSAPAAIR